MKRFNLIFSLLICVFATVSVSAQFDGSNSGYLTTENKVNIGTTDTNPWSELTVVEGYNKHGLTIKAGDPTASPNILFEAHGKEAAIRQSGANGELGFIVSNSQGVRKHVMSLDNEQKVRIGATNLPTPGEYKLYVEEGILTEKVRVALKDEGDWADYVFEEDYNLNSIEEVASFVTENKHLPNVPSAKELVNKGLNVAEMDAKLLRQIEELWLHTIESNKRNTALQTKLNQVIKQNEELTERLEKLEE